METLNDYIIQSFLNHHSASTINLMLLALDNSVPFPISESRE